MLQFIVGNFLENQKTHKVNVFDHRVLVKTEDEDPVNDFIG